METVVVVGGGPSGITAAVEAARLGMKVTLITAEEPGGRANWHSLLPSKVYLDFAEQYRGCQKYIASARDIVLSRPDPGEIKEKISSVSRAWHAQIQKSLLDRQVQIQLGTAALAGNHQLVIRSENEPESKIFYDKLILATGSVPVFLPQLKPDGKSILAPRFAQALKRWPEHIVVIGAGATGGEFAYLFAQMDCQVTWITDQAEILPRFDAEIADPLELALQNKGVSVLKESAVTGVVPDMGGVVVTLRGGRAIVASHAFIAIGRKADISGLNLDAAGVHYDQNGIHINDYSQTSNPDIYAVGDVAGFPYTVNKGQQQGYTAARHLAGQEVQPLRPDLLVEAVYTRPTLAQVGLNRRSARVQNKQISTLCAGYETILAGHLRDDLDGFLEIHYDAGRKVVGGAAVGSNAPDQMAILAAALRAQMRVDELADFFPAYPTASELLPETVRGGAVKKEMFRSS